MGTNLLNLFPFFLDKRTCHGVRLRLLRPVIWLCFRLRFVSAPDPEPSITTCYSGNFRLSFRFPFGFLPGGSNLKSVLLFILRFPAFRVLSLSFGWRFPSKTSCNLRHTLFYTLNFTTQRTLCFFYLLAVRCFHGTYALLLLLRRPA